MQYFVGFLFPGSAAANIGCCGKLSNYLMASCVRNIRTKNIKTGSSFSIPYVVKIGILCPTVQWALAIVSTWVVLDR